MTTKKGVLYVVATPIGNLADISQRAKTTLESVAFVAAEDTRHTGQLLKHLGIKNKLVSLHDFNERNKTAFIIEQLEQGENIALVSDAGTPLISDPGFFLVREVRSAGFTVVPVPGACAMVAALSVSGIATDRFAFEGFLASKSATRQKQLKALVNEQRTMIFYESTHRIESSIGDMKSIFGGERHATIARELTKTFETIYTDTLDNLINWMHGDKQQKKGEFVVIVSGNPQESSSSEIEADRMVDILLTQLPITQAASLVAEISGERKKDLYQRALNRKNDE